MSGQPGILLALLAWPLWRLSGTHPYAVNLQHVTARYLDLQRRTAAWSPAQRRETQIVLWKCVMEATLTMHEQALAVRDWDAGAFTLG